MPLSLVTPGRDVPNDVNVIIEIPLRSDLVKYEKDLEAGKWVKIDGWLGPEEAKTEIVSSIARFKAAPDKPQF